MNEDAFKRVRPARAAGRFYPANPAELRRVVESLLADVPAPVGPVPKALIVPHAGYVYSGPVAASAYAQLLPARESIRRVVLLGPSHFVPCDGLALCSADAFATPLGRVPVDTEAAHRLKALSQVVLLDEAHAMEHSLEVQLPFLQVVLREFTLVPLAVGDADPDAISQVLEQLWDGPETRFVISSDLSHYQDWATARAIDQTTAAAIEGLRPEDIADDQACGCAPVRGLLQAARLHRLQAHTLDLRNSGDTGGARERVVGYGAFAFKESGAETGARRH